MATNNYLKHHGILGQKWGVRRFQNLDGSLTPAGKNRYGMTQHDQKKLANDLKGVGDAPYKLAISRALSNSGVKKAIVDYQEKAKTLKEKSKQHEEIDKQWFNEPDSVAKKYYKKHLDKIIQEEIDAGFIDPIKDKDYIKETYNLRTDLALEPEEVQENAKLDYIKDKGLLKQYRESIKADGELYKMAGDVAKELLGKYGNQSVGKNPNKWITYEMPVELRLQSIITDSIKR